uniref:Ribonuclease H-like domain-containing protein n=1 Tax=Tanacetum cinerariifolium TaxID=118510 RepID=A0A6L2ME49_TANCI|nr:ribonuclease H-like domain-containing protein [Tanacetum cinerariifolium]
MTTPTFAKTHNLIDYLSKPTESEGFEQIIDFLNGSSVRYALTASLTIRTSSIKQFWSTTKVKTINDEVRVQAQIDGKKVTIKESSIRCTLRLDDEEGTSCLANDDIFTGLANMGYDKMSDKLTFYKAFFSRQWKFMQLLVDHQLGDMSHHQDIYDNPSLTKKVFSNMKRVGTCFSRVITPLFKSMLVQAAEEVREAQDDVSIPAEPSTSKPYKNHKSKKQQLKAPKVPSPAPSPEHQLPSPLNDPIPTAKDSLTLQELKDLCTRLSNKVLDLDSDVIDIKYSFIDRIQKLEDRVDQLEEENKALKQKSFKTTQVDIAAPVENMEKSFKQGRMTTDMDEDDTDKEEPAEVEDVLEVVKATKLMTEVVTTAQSTTTAAQVPNPSAPRKRRGVVIQDHEEIAASVIVHSEVQSKDKGKRILIKEPKPLKGQAQIDMDEEFARQLEAELNANINWNDVIEQVKRRERQDNTVMSEIRPIFKKHYNSIQAFLEKEEEEVTVQEKEELIHLQIVVNDDDDDVYTEATPLASKKLLKERFEATEPKNFSDDFLLNILKIMFEKPNVKANVWRDQKGRYGLVKQMLENVRLEVKEESEMSLELLSMDDWEADHYENANLGISVTRSSSWIFLSQRKYVTENLKLAGMVSCKSCRTPVDIKSKQSNDGDLVSDLTLYWSLTSSLQYLTFTLLNIYYAVQQRTKHIKIDIHFVRDLVVAGQVRVLHVPLRYQYADIFTKGLPYRFEHMVSSRFNCRGVIHHEDVVDHIAMVLEMLDLINIPGVDSHRLRIKRRMDDNILNSGDTAIDSILEPYLKNREKNNTEKDDERRQTKRKCKDANLETNNTSNTLNNEQPNKRMCNAERFEAIKYSLGPNEEYIAIRRCEYDT